jgi:uncharacterized phage-like protein YoqJ
MIIEKERIISYTGHRPGPKIFKSDYYSDENFNTLVDFACQVLLREKPDLSITGGALGWDQAVAQASLNLAMPYELHIPFEGFDSNWPTKSRNRLKDLMESAEKVKVVCGSYSLGAYQKRNESMVDTSDKVIALFDFSSGGTANCVSYAKSKNKPITHVYHAWLEYRDAK